MNAFNSLKPETVEDEQKLADRYREHGLRALRLAALSFFLAFIGTWISTLHPDPRVQVLFKALSWGMCAACVAAFVSGLVFLFFWFTLRNDPDFWQ